MTKEFYDYFAAPFEKNEKKRRRLTRFNNILTYIIFIIYPALLVYLAIMRDWRFWRALVVPAVSFVIVTVFRKVCNAKRPYEVWDIEPLIHKESKGNSFPSRHIFSIYIIATAVFYIYMPAGIVIAIAGIFLAMARVAARLHFIRDVVAGALIGIVLGYVGFFIL